MMLRLLFLFLAFASGAEMVLSQTGPNSPQTRANNAAIGTNAWTNPADIISANNVYASVSTKGITNYLQGSQFNFAISVPSSITGISLEIERSTNTATNVALLNAWSTGMTKAISAGVARCLIVAVFMENGTGARDVTAITYGGQSMTQITEATVGTPAAFTGKIEYWQLMEAGIVAATNTSFILTFDGTALSQNWEAVTSAVYQFVDQSIPVSDTKSFSSNNATNPITLSPVLNTLIGGMSVSGVFCGNNTTPASAVNGTNTYSLNSGFTEVVDTYSANTGFTGSGGAFQVAHKATAASGTEGPAYTFSGTANRQVACCIHLQRIREADHSVRLVKGGVITGNDYAQTSTSWPPTDTYTTYGGAADLWGTTWTDAEINAANFGAVISTSVQNGTARVDHMRITIYSFSTLPVELTRFFGEHKNGFNYLYWATATEINNKLFEVERSTDGIEFITIGSIPGKGNSLVFNSYELCDHSPATGVNYYRLKQTDTDGTFSYHKLIALDASIGNDEWFPYPNPSCDGLFKIARSPLNTGQIQVYSSDLKLVKSLLVETEDLNLSLEELADGNYYLVYTSGADQTIKRLQKSCRGN